MISPRIPARALLALAAILALSLTLLAGCAARQADPRILKGQGLNHIRDVAVSEHPREDGFLLLQITGTNTASKARPLWYAVEWFDADGLILDSFQARWKEVTVEGKMPFVITELSPRPTAKTWRLMLKHDLK